jgi:hypothetical protein
LLNTASCKSEKLYPYETDSVKPAQASWAKSYNNLSELCFDTELVVIGVIDSVSEVIQANDHLYFTNFRFRIDTTLKGDTSKEIVIHQVGASDKTWTEIADDPLFHVGEKYLLFLKSNNPGIYFHPGPWGRYQIKDSKVYSLNHLLKGNEYTAPTNLDFNGVEVKEFVLDVQENVRAGQ